MGFFIQNKQNQRNSERFIVFFFFLYNLNLCISAIRRGWPSWIPSFMLGAALISLAALILKYKNYQSRARLTVCMIQFSVILYAAHVDDLRTVIPTFMFLTVLSAFYGISKLMWIPLASELFIVFYQCGITHVLDITDKETAIRLLTQTGNIFCLVFALRAWLKSRNESNEQVFKIIDALMEAEQSKDDFLSNISHEIRTPVNTITGMSEMALREKSPEKLMDEIFDIRDAGRNLMSLVSDILDFAQLQQGKIAIEEEIYNVTSTVNDIISMATARKGDKPIELIVDCAADLPSGLLGDEKKIRRVIMNLVDNAVKFTDKGCVCIDVEARKESYGINLCITVKDSGIGISEESMEKLFESFSQADTRKNRANGGVGLGLAISKELVSKMGGTMTVRSHLGKGSMFRFVVPQKVLNEAPIVQVENKDKLNIATYFDMEQFEMMAIRDEYSNLIAHMVRQLQVKCRVCRNLSELKRRHAHNAFTHIFISLEEYQEDEAFFDKVAETSKVILVIERYNEKYISNPGLPRLYKPFYILPVVSILNGNTGWEGGRQMARPGKFTTKDAHVLVVDDNMMNIRVIEGLLNEYKIKVTYAASGQEALKLIENMSYDFVFMDHMMPEMDGVETLRRIRDKAGRYYQHVPIIALTANAAPGNREMFLEEGFTDFLAKPVEISVLERVLKRTLPEEKIIDLPQDKTKTDMSDDRFVIGRLDVSSGMLYCGGRQAYLGVLQSCLAESENNMRLIGGLYGKQDWKNYTIKVHALKSAMKSIGALPLSEKAKALENAGKKGDIDYIKNNHDAMIEEYQSVMEEIAQSPLVGADSGSGAPADLDSSPSTDASPLREMDDAAFDAKIGELENALYALDGDQMLSILDSMQNCLYRQIPLEKKLAPIQKKIEMSDYMSALDLLSQVRDDIKNERK